MAGLGLVAGASTAIVLLGAFNLVASLPLGLLGSTVLLAWGLLGLSAITQAHLERDADDAFITALIPFLGIPMILRRVSPLVPPELPVALQAPILFEVLSVASALVLLVVVDAALARAGVRGADAAYWVGGLGVALLVAGLVALVSLGQPPPTGAVVVLSLTVLIVLAATGSQWLVARRSHSPHAAAFGSGPALAIAAAQLLDGVVSYLAVADPLGRLGGVFHESVPVSAFLIETTGPGFAVLKWSIALVAVHYVDGGGRGVDEIPGTTRLGVYLLIGLLGLGPGLFSATQLLV